MKYSTLKALFISASIALAFNVHAFTPTAAQLTQFQNLSPSQQQALAKQYGIDLGSFSTQGSAQPQFEQTPNAMRQSTASNKAIEQAAQQSTNSTTLKEDKESRVTQQALKQFGYDLFNNNAGSFMPATDIPTPENYLLGPGDSLIVQLYGKQNASHALTINREGQIQFPDIGPINLAGLNFSEAKQQLNQLVAEKMIGVRSSITMGSMRSIRVFILGEAKQPGSYTINALSTMTNALLMSGGIDQIGSLRNIQLKRQGKVVTTLDLYDLLLKGDTSNDSRLQPGDVIFIPPIGKTAGINGEVRRPGIYELTTETTTQQLVDLAGGLLATAYPQASRIERINTSGNRTLLDINLTASKGQLTRLHDGDVVQVFSVLNTMEEVVLIEGHVKRPGGFAFNPKQHFTDLLPTANDLLPNPDLHVGLILRELQPTRQIETLLFNPGNAFLAPKSKHDPELQSRDKIIIFNFKDDRSELLHGVVQQLNIQANHLQRRQTAAIHGQVRFPGNYPLSKNMSAKDLITLAGGLTDRAFSLSAEITRYSFNPQQEQSIKHINVDLTASKQPLLLAEDSLQIKRTPNWVGTETITIEGEVAFPGKYTIQRGETLSQLLARAGGINEYAFVEAAVFTREELRSNEAKQLAAMRERLESDLANSNIEAKNTDQKIAVDDAEDLLDKLQTSSATGRMVIDLKSIIENPSQNDVVLKDGDTLRIPRYRQAVTIIGEVQYPTSHIFDSKLDLEDYLERSGETTQKADKSRIYIVKADGSVHMPTSSRWFSRSSQQIQPGDTIVVPYDSERMKPLPFWSSVSQIFYQMALGAAAVNSF